jgi:hypothetical protein
VVRVYVQVASYRIGSGTTPELVERIEEGNIPVVREVPGFVAYYAFDAGEGVATSVSIFEDKAGVEEAEARLGSWIEQTMQEFEVTPLDVLEGDVIARSAA